MQQDIIWTSVDHYLGYKVLRRVHISAWSKPVQQGITPHSRVAKHVIKGNQLSHSNWRQSVCLNGSIVFCSQYAAALDATMNDSTKGTADSVDDH